MSSLPSNNYHLNKSLIKHKDALIPFLNGESIQYQSLLTGEWIDTTYPYWGKDTNYRVAPKKHTRTVWINIYAEGDETYLGAILHSSKEKADKGAGTNRIACKSVTFEVFQGEGL